MIYDTRSVLFTSYLSRTNTYSSQNKYTDKVANNNHPETRKIYGGSA